MKILIISFPNPYKTAGIVAFDIYEGFNQFPGIETKLLVKAYSKHGDSNIISFENYYKSKLERIRRKLRNIYSKISSNIESLKKTNPDYYVQDLYQTKEYFRTEKILKKINFNPDVILVLFMQEFITYKNLFEINRKTGAKIFLYLMDMAPLTGVCHYTWDCKGYAKECGFCPALYSAKGNDQSRKNLIYKKKFAKKTEMAVIAGSEWQYQYLKNSAIFRKKPKYKILLPINKSNFNSADKIAIRNYLKLPRKTKIIFFGAKSISNKRKGFRYLLKALNILHNLHKEKENIHLIFAGNNITEYKDQIPFNYTFLGHLSHDELPKVFQASDVFVSSSIEDAGPMMINQSIMCGTPVVAFEVGIALDLVITNKTGYRARLFDCDEFAFGIEQIINLDEEKYNIMSANCRELGLELCHPTKNINKMINIFNTIKFNSNENSKIGLG